MTPSLSGMRTHVLVATAACMLMASISGCSGGEGGGATSTVSQGKSAERAAQEAGARRVQVNFPINIANRQRLAGFADAVFVGKVESVTPGEERYGTPWTAARVKVQKRLKGNPPDTANVEQQGGSDRSTGRLVLVEGDSLIQQGDTYIVAARASKERGSFVVVPVYGLTRLEAGNDDQAVKDWEAAVAGAIPFN